MSEETPLEAGPQTETTEVVESSTLAGNPDQQAGDKLASVMPENWRDIMSGGDEKIGSLLSRYASPDAAGKALMEARQKISSGEYRKPLSQDASEEDISLFREMNGIPSTPEGYDVKLSDGRELSEQERASVGSFLKEVAHPNNLTPATVNAVLDWDQQRADQREQELAQADAEYRKASEDSLREQWGGDYRQNLNLVTTMFDQAPEGIKDSFLGARLADGTLLGDNPEVLNLLAGWAREVNPVGTVAPGYGAGDQQAVSSRIADIEKLIGDYESEYWKGSNAKNLQDEYDRLLQAKAKLAS